MKTVQLSCNPTLSLPPLLSHDTGSNFKLRPFYSSHRECFLSHRLSIPPITWFKSNKIHFSLFLNKYQYFTICLCFVLLFAYCLFILFGLIGCKKHKMRGFSEFYSNTIALKERKHQGRNDVIVELNIEQYIRSEWEAVQHSSSISSCMLTVSSMTALNTL